ncbi:hypothetical protein HYC85_019853, partial [Camellia sinensis]
QIQKHISSLCYQPRLSHSPVFHTLPSFYSLLLGKKIGSGVVFVKNSNGGGVGCSEKVVRECRICQEEDEEHQMEAPCACNGTLKVYSPNYILPPKSNPEVMAIDIRQPWGPHIDLRDSHFLALTAAERQFLQSEYDDYGVANSSLACIRSVAIILMLILLIRQVLMVTRDFGMVQEPSTFFNFQVTLLQFAGFLLPCYVMIRSWYISFSRDRKEGINCWGTLSGDQSILILSMGALVFCTHCFCL